MARINLKRSTVLLVTGRAEPVDLLGRTWSMRSPGLIPEIPEHIRLQAGNRDRMMPLVNRHEVLRRDRHNCHYYGSNRQPMPHRKVPRSHGEAWVATACTHNSRTPELADMSLKQRPKTPMPPVIAFAKQFWRERTR